MVLLVSCSIEPSTPSGNTMSSTWQWLPRATAKTILGTETDKSISEDAWHSGHDVSTSSRVSLLYA